jgi:hypothetical protein
MRASRERGDCAAPVLRGEEAEDVGLSRSFEPLLAGDRQKQKRVAKARNPLQKGSFEVSLS